MQDRNNTTGSYTLSVSVPSDDHGGSITAATSVEASSSTSGNVDYQGDQDYFSFEAEADTRYLVRLAMGTLSYTSFSLSNSSGQRLGSAESYQNRETPIAYTPTVAETIYVAVQPRSNDNTTGSYTLSISTPSDDHGDSSSKATAVELGSTSDSTIEYQGDQDYFSFEAEAGTTYLIELTMGTLNYANFSLSNSSGQRLASADSYQSSNTPIAYTPTSAGTLYVAVQPRSYDNTTGSYTLSVSAPTDDHGGSITEATAVGPSSSTAGIFDYQGDRDYFSFEVKAGTTYLVHTGLGTTTYTNTVLYNESGQQLASADSYQGRETPFAYTATATQTLYAAVQSRNKATGSYTLALFEFTGL